MNRPLRSGAVVRKTNAVRLLDSAGILYELREYQVEVGDDYARRVAEEIGLDPACVFKTLVATGDRYGPCLAVVPADAELDLKAMAAVTGDRKVHLAPLDQVRALTGYVPGAVTALATKRALPVVVDESASSFAAIAVSAGMAGIQIVLAPSDYLAATGARPAPIARRMQEP